MDHLKQFNSEFVDKEAFKISERYYQMFNIVFLKNLIKDYQPKSLCKDLKYFRRKYIKLEAFKFLQNCCLSYLTHFLMFELFPSNFNLCNCYNYYYDGYNYDFQFYFIHKYYSPFYQLKSSQY